MRKPILAACLALCATSAWAQSESGAAMSVPFVGTDGKPVGTASLTDTPNGVLLVVQIEAGLLPAGEHAIHFHAIGDCSDLPKFEKAGEHHNPGGHEHGFKIETGPHEGDMPNITVVADQTAEASILNAMVRFSGGNAALMDADGSAIVIHAGADDYESQPSGASGDRIACAAITAN